MNGAANDSTDQRGCILSVDNESLYSSHGNEARLWHVPDIARILYESISQLSRA